MKVPFILICLFSFCFCFGQQKVMIGTDKFVDWVSTTYVGHFDSAKRNITFERNEYMVKYIYDPTFCMVPMTNPPGFPHYDAIITVYQKTLVNNKYKYIQIGEPMMGQYVSGGCFEDVPEDYIKHALSLESKNKLHRKHVSGMVFTTYPPIYSCNICYKEFSPYQVLPKEYSDMRIPMTFGKDTFYFNGYGRFCDSLKKNHINEDSFFFAKWNEIDTTCINYEIKVKKSEDIWHTWLKTHKKGRYYLNKDDWMDTDNWMGGKDYVMGGRFDDKVLLVNKWYKIVYDKKK